MDVQKLVANIPTNTITSKLGGATYTSKVCTPDSFFASNDIAEILNSKLKNIYGIKSDIKDKTLLGKIYSVVQEFCELNENDKLFNNLTIQTRNLPAKEYKRVIKMQDNYTLSFNKGVDWKNIEQITKDLFNKGHIASQNPKYLIYQGFGDFLNFSNNPKAHYKCADLFYEKDCASLPFRICNSTSLEAFNSHVTAAKMSKEFLPSDVEKYMRENTGNLSLKFPEALANYIEGSKIKFNTTDEAVEFLKQFGIQAEFSDIRQANLCAQAVEDLIQAVDNKQIFNGLKIKNSPETFANNSETVAQFDFNYKTHENDIKLNPNIQWQNSENLMAESFNNMFHPTTKVKDYFIHELSHYIDFKGNPEKFLEMENKFGGFNTSGIFATSKVSEYATEDPAEFCAEYICGKMAGIEYPEVTDKLFQQFWNGCKLNFPKTK